jgi:hypothetical protein
MAEIPITSSEPQFAATKAIPVMASGSDRPTTGPIAAKTVIHADQVPMARPVSP